MDSTLILFFNILCVDFVLFYFVLFSLLRTFAPICYIKTNRKDYGNTC
jgi:hypothetical protein